MLGVGWIGRAGVGRGRRRRLVGKCLWACDDIWVIEGNELAYVDRRSMRGDI